MTTNDITIHEVARLALANHHWREMISEILDLSDAEMDHIQHITEMRLNVDQGIRNSVGKSIKRNQS